VWNEREKELERDYNNILIIIITFFSPFPFTFLYVFFFIRYFAVVAWNLEASNERLKERMNELTGAL